MIARHCPAPACGAPIAEHQLTCLPHWWALTPRSRARVRETWHQRGAKPEAHLRAVRDALAELAGRN